MAAHQAQNLLSSSAAAAADSPSVRYDSRFSASLHAPSNVRIKGRISLPKLLANCLHCLGLGLAAAVNTLEHGGQVGMVFEPFRNCGGFYRRLQQEIEANLGERDLQKRENGKLFEIKMALQLGRSLPELEDLASYASPLRNDEDIKEFAGWLF